MLPSVTALVDALAAVPPTRFAGVQAGTIALLDVRPAAEPAGSGGTVVFVPGWTGSKEDFLLMLDPLSRAGLRVVTYDQRGQHESHDASTNPDDFTVERLADDLLDLVDAIEVGPVHVVGHSFGGLVARAAVLARPSSFRSLVLLASGPAALRGPRVDRTLALAPILESGGMAALHVALEQQALEQQAADARATAVPEAWRELLRRRFLASSPVALQATGRALATEPDRVAELAELTSAGLPALVLHGEADDAWSPADQADMARRLGAQHVVLPDVAHSPALEDPAGTVRALREFWELS